MGEAAELLIEPKQSELVDKVKELLPDGNLNMCLTCGACSSGCPATGMHDMDPRKFLRLALLGQEEEIRSTPWGLALHHV